MENGLFQCEISPGQFTGEYAVSGVMFDGEGFSLFATQSDLRLALSFLKMISQFPV